LAGQKTAAGAEWGKYAAKNTLFIRLSFRIEREIKSFPDKQKLKELLTTKPTLQTILKHTLSGKERPKATKTRKEQRTSTETPTLQVTQRH